MAQRVFLVQWDERLAEQQADELRSAGYDADVESHDGGAALDRIKAEPPAAVVVDLTRKPAHGREVLSALADSRATAQIPILVLSEGEAADAQPVADRLRAILPS
jgi:DNA-binding response OmpR family regulator